MTTAKQETITATFEDGVFKPDGPVAVQPGSRVRLRVLEIQPSQAERLAMLKELDEICRRSPIDSGGDWLTRDERCGRVGRSKESKDA